MAHLRHAVLDTAVARITAAAQSQGRTGFVMTVGEWGKLVLFHMKSGRIAKFGMEILTPSLTLGCGTFGGNSTTDNITYTHLLNIKRLALNL